MTTGADLVKSQIDVVRGLDWDRPEEGVFGHAIERASNAENPAKGFQPAPGLVRVFQPPSGPGLRIDSGVVEGMSIAPEFGFHDRKIDRVGDEPAPKRWRVSHEPFTSSRSWSRTGRRTRHSC